MLRLMKKEIDLEGSPVLYDAGVSEEMLARDWDIHNGEWWAEDGWIHGRNRENAPSMIVSKKDFKGNVMVSFEARTVLPSTHDIDFMWNGCWDEAQNARGMAYVAGLEGWWEGKVGFEKSPDYALNVATQLFTFVPGQTYQIAGGSVDGHCFVLIDGALALEITDPDPIDAMQFARVGFEAYCSHIQIRNIQVRQLRWTELEQRYAQEF